MFKNGVGQVIVAKKRWSAKLCLTEIHMGRAFREYLIWGCGQGIVLWRLLGLVYPFLSFQILERYAPFKNSVFKGCITYDFGTHKIGAASKSGGKEPCAFLTEINSSKGSLFPELCLPKAAVIAKVCFEKRDIITKVGLPEKGQPAEF
ncbi:MAG: hypothetical protein PVG03_06435 [Desulfarculaceae bacterium]